MSRWTHATWCPVEPGNNAACTCDTPPPHPMSGEGPRTPEPEIEPEDRLAALERRIAYLEKRLIHHWHYTREHAGMTSPEDRAGQNYGGAE